MRVWFEELLQKNFPPLPTIFTTLNVLLFSRLYLPPPPPHSNRMYDVHWVAENCVQLFSEKQITLPCDQLIFGLSTHNVIIYVYDRFLLMADFDAYVKCQERVSEVFQVRLNSIIIVENCVASFMLKVIVFLMFQNDAFRQ